MNKPDENRSSVFPPINQWAPHCNGALPSKCQRFCLRCSSGICTTQAVVLGLTIQRKLVWWFRPVFKVSMVSSCQREVALQAGCVCDAPMKRWLCVLRSLAHRGQSSCVTLAQLELSSRAEVGESKGGRTHVRVLDLCQSSVGSSGWTGSEWRINWVCVYTFTSVNTHLAAGMHKHTLPKK